MIVSQLAEEAVLQLQWELIHLDPTLVVQTKVDEQLLCKTPGEEKYSQVRWWIPTVWRTSLYWCAINETVDA